MTGSGKTADIIVIGGGLSGAAVALGLIENWAGRILMLDEQLPTQRLSRGNFGLTWFMCKGANQTDYALWARKACKAWPEFAGKLTQDTGIDLELEWTGGAIHAFGEEAFNAHARSVAGLRAICAAAGLDYPVEMLDRKAFEELLPGIALGESVTGAMYSPEQGHVNPLKLLAALRLAFQKKGGQFMGSRTVSALAPQSDGSVLVKTSRGNIQAQKVVVAAGHGSTRLLAPLGEKLNIYPQKGQLMVSQRCPRVLTVPTLSVRQTPDGTFLIGLSTEDAAMDSRVTAEAMQRQAAEAIRLFPMLGRVNWVRGWGAIRVMTPDGAPIYSRIGGHGNIFVMALHSAVSLAPLAAGAIARWVLGSDQDQLISKFGNNRFNV